MSIYQYDIFSSHGPTDFISFCHHFMYSPSSSNISIFSSLVWIQVGINAYWVTSCKCHTFTANPKFNLSGNVFSFAKISKSFSSKHTKMMKLLHGVNVPWIIMLTIVCTFHVDWNSWLWTQLNIGPSENAYKQLLLGYRFTVLVIIRHRWSDDYH